MTGRFGSCGYLKKPTLLKRFNMSKTKAIVLHFKLNSKQCPTSEKEKEEISRLPYAYAIDNLIYAMVCARPSTANAVGVESKFLSNFGKEN